MKSVWPLLMVLLLTSVVIRSSCAQNVILQENFDQLPLDPPKDEDAPNFTEAYTHNAPPGWFVQRTNIPGVGDPLVGVEEWEGWSFADKNFWIQVANDERRSEFSRGQGTVAVADPDEWNDLGFESQGGPANALGFYNTFMQTEFIPFSSIPTTDSRLKFQFASSWRSECCDDGREFAENLNNKTAIVRAVRDDGQVFPLLHWESAPNINPLDSTPSDNPLHPDNPDFKPDDTNELVFLDLSPLINFSAIGAGGSGPAGFHLEFGLAEAGDDYWWAVDNMQMTSLTEVDGDMDLNGVLEEADIDDFAEAIHSPDAYIANHYGESPAVRGSPDSQFDFDDIDWFVSLFQGSPLSVTRDTIIDAIDAYAVPEPATGGLTAVLFGIAITHRRIRR